LGTPSIATGRHTGPDGLGSAVEGRVLVRHSRSRSCRPAICRPLALIISSKTRPSSTRSARPSNDLGVGTRLELRDDCLGLAPCSARARPRRWSRHLSDLSTAAWIAVLELVSASRKVARAMPAESRSDASTSTPVAR